MTTKRVADYTALLRTGRWFREIPSAFREVLVSTATLNGPFCPDATVMYVPPLRGTPMTLTADVQ